MRVAISAIVPWGLLVLLCGCSRSSAERALAEQIVGKWHLVRVDGKPPAESLINAYDLDIAADGKWKSKIKLDDLNLDGGGTWSLTGDAVTYTNGENKGTSRVTLKDGRMILDPDFHLRKNDATKAPITCEYER